MAFLVLRRVRVPSLDEPGCEDGGKDIKGIAAVVLELDLEESEKGTAEQRNRRKRVGYKAQENVRKISIINIWLEWLVLCGFNLRRYRFMKHCKLLFSYMEAGLIKCNLQWLVSCNIAFILEKGNRRKPIALISPTYLSISLTIWGSCST